MPPQEYSIDAEVEAYRSKLEAKAKGKTSSVSESTKKEAILDKFQASPLSMLLLTYHLNLLYIPLRHKIFRKESFMAKKSNCSVNGKKKYRTRAKIGTRPDGSPIFKNFYGDSKKDAEQKKSNYLNRNDGVLNGLTLFGEIFWQWLNIVKKPSIANSTYDQIYNKWKVHIKPSKLARIKLADVTSADVQYFLNACPSPHIAKKCISHIRNFLRYCIKENLIKFNPADNVTLPKNSDVKKEKKYFSEKDISILTNAFSDGKVDFIYIFALMTGLRQGEILALTHEDINLFDKTATVNKSLSRERDENGHIVNVIKTTKNKSSLRIAPIPDSIVKSLNLHMRLEKEKHLALGIPFNQSCLLFTNQMCSPIRRDKLTKAWRKLQTNLGLTSINFHGLRHSYCTLLALNDVDLKTASVLMGHSNISTTAQIYTHIDAKRKQYAANKLNNVL
jgi:integrase